MINDYFVVNSTGNCTPAAILEFPRWLTSKPPRYDLVGIAAFICFFLFWGLAIICDEYCVPAVERLCFSLKMPFNIAGATFMAAATSSPEFFVQMIGTFVTEGDIGVGTIVGSSMFNILAISACCCLFTNVRIPLDWWPITRDTFWYLTAVTILSCIIVDGVVYWYEALGLVIMYIINLLFLFYNQQIKTSLRDTGDTCLPCFTPKDNALDLIDNRAVDDHGESSDEVYNPAKFPIEGNCFTKFAWVVSWPLQLLFFLTVPNCKRSWFRNWYVFSLVMCVVWISLLSYGTAWMITVIGNNFFIPDSIMGITFLAAGTSIPEAIASIAVTRKGYGSMPICNAISSNTFDIFVCLGVPWLFKTTIGNGKKSDYILLNSRGLRHFSFTLFVATIVLYVGFVCTQFTLGRGVGFFTLVGYLLYLVVACLVECNVFFVVNMDTCPYE